MKAKYSLEQEQEENPNHSDGFGMYWSGFFTCLKEISFFLDSLHLDTLSEEPDKGLEEEMDRFFEEMSIQEHENIFEDTYQMIARHFYELGKNAK